MARRLRAGVRAEDLAAIEASRVLPYCLQSPNDGEANYRKNPTKLVVREEVATDNSFGENGSKLPLEGERSGKVLHLRRSMELVANSALKPELPMLRLGLALREAREKIMRFDIDVVVACRVGFLSKVDGGEAGSDRENVKKIRPVRPDIASLVGANNDNVEIKRDVTSLKLILKDVEQ
jgi:hypothetical protein